MARTTIEIPLNRVEGDLEIKVEVEDGVVRDAWSAGTLYRGFETIMVGRGPLDGLVITPRVCGICSTAHLSVAAAALDSVAGLEVAPNGQRVRNATLAVENLQSDVRQLFLFFTVDFTNPAFGKSSLYEEAVRRYRAFEGSAVVETIQKTKHLLEIVAILGGQWPHSSFMVPGGVVSLPNPADIARCRLILGRFREHYEQRILGCALQRFAEIDSVAALDEWLDEAASHRDSDVGFFLRYAREAGLDRIGRGHGLHLSCGAFPDADGAPRIPAGFAEGLEVRPFDQAKIAEQVGSSWFIDRPGEHPYEGETRPYASGREGKKYSWAKAPRYDGRPAETGPLSEAIVAGDRLICDLVRRDGESAMVRALARLLRPVRMLPAIDRWLAEIVEHPGPFCAGEVHIPDGRGHGLTMAARGALGHWMVVERGKITRYQIITPTTWNGSPRDDAGVRGPWEEALIGTPVSDLDDPVFVGLVIRSFDPCLVCTVHAVGSQTRKRIG